VKCYIDNFVRLWSCIRNVNTCDTAPTTATPQAPDEAPHAPGTYNANAATSRRRTIDASKVRLCHQHNVSFKTRVSK
jgi:hypothetical protein